MTRYRPGNRAAARITVAVLAIVSCGFAIAHLRATAPEPSSLVTLSIVGTSDLHGVALPRNGLGGLPLLAGYVNNLRAARRADRGAVLLLDSGDTFQGGIESNLSEGAMVVDAYNAMGYTAAAIGNHDFDYGPVDSRLGRQSRGDARGALKARAVQAHYPFLAANLIDEKTGRAVEWPNVRPSVIVDAAGVKVGVIGVMTFDGLASTVLANVHGLRVAPLVATISAEASKLRAAGAEVVVVVSHAGGRCDRFDQPSDLSSCDQDSEIFQVARNLPRGLVNVIAAGHTHQAIAHEVDGIGIIQPFARGLAFGRVDVFFDKTTNRIQRLQLYPPQRLCLQPDQATGNCVAEATSVAAMQYEARAVTPDETVVQAMVPALDRVRQLQATTLGVALDAPITRGGEATSPLGDVVADALLAALPSADAAVINNATRLFADLPGGPLTFGRLYDVFPFDNRIVGIRLTGADFRQWVVNEIRQGPRALLGISGVTIRTSCAADALHVDLVRGSGGLIHDEDSLVVATIGYPTLNGSVALAGPLGGGDQPESAPVAREAFEDWFRRAGHVVHVADLIRRQSQARTQTANCH